ncbi:MAG: hypothetical protein CVU87_12605 [Firmicutes bacterium HGW-Firmicutes-12]|jgi:uncharacterized membrane-anchored protein YjiN (DUF445 family)|nr:MAG: hypothetical protein CVU87_12605 [Firmicutes bacterium HGW-Firmicutes-12]
MVTDELLTKENLKQRLSTLDLSKLLIDYLLRHGGIEGIQSIIAELVRDIIDKLDPQDVGGILEEFLKRIVHRVKINPILAEGIEHSLKNGYDHKLIGFVADELIRILQQKPIVEVIKSTIVTSIQDYDRGSKLRQIIDRLFLNDHDRYAQTVQQKAIEFLLEVKVNKNHSLRILLIERLESLLDDLRKSPELQIKIETWKLEIIEQKLNINQLIAEFIQTQKEAAFSGEGLVLEWLEQLKEVSKVWVERFEENEEHRGQFNAWVRSKLEAIIDKEHGQIGKLVRDNLDRYSNEELVSLLENKVGSDLQMIRLNGSIVGGLVGIILFLINHVVVAVL